MPLPIMTTSAVEGRFLVDRWPMSSGEGSECQNDADEVGCGRSQGFLCLGISGFERDMVCLIDLCSELPRRSSIKPALWI